MAESKIEWTDYTFNPWWGCERVSPGCAHCYADTIATRYGHAGTWGAGHGFRFFGAKHWAEPLKWNAKAEREGRRFRVFCASMADVFEERIELDEWRDLLFDLIFATPHLDWQLLTKRPEFARDWLTALYAQNPAEYGGQPWPTVWLGVSIENSRHTWRADVLREIPAAVRFISAEPLLGSLFDDSQGRLTRKHGAERDGRGGIRRVGGVERERSALDLTGIDWIIVGGESGPGARPFHLEHAREIIDAAAEHSDHVYEGGVTTSVFVKQLGARPTIDELEFGLIHKVVTGPDAGRGNGPFELGLRDRKGGDWDEWPDDLRIREFPRRSA